MKINTYATVIGKTKGALEEKTEGGKTRYSLRVVSKEDWYDVKNKKRLVLPVTVYVNFYGSFPDGLKNILNKAGVPVIITGDLSKKVSVDRQTGKPITYNSGERAGDYMYDLSLSTSSGNLTLAPRASDSDTDSTSSDNTSAVTSDERDEMYI